MLAPSQVYVELADLEEPAVTRLQPWEKNIILRTSPKAREILYKMSNSEDKLGSLRSSVNKLLDPIIEDVDDYNEAGITLGRLENYLEQGSIPSQAISEARERKDELDSKMSEIYDRIKTKLRRVRYSELEDEITNAVLQNPDREALFNLSPQDQIIVSNMFEKASEDLHDNSFEDLREEMMGESEAEGFRILQRPWWLTSLMKLARVPDD